MKSFRIILFFLALAFDVSAQILKESSFENPMPTPYTGCCNASYSPWSCIEGSTSYAHSISTTFKRSGNSSLRTEGKKGDPAVCYGSYREEHTPISKGIAVQTAANTYRISMYIPASNSPWVNESQESIVGFQFHPWSGSSTAGSPSLALEIKAGRFRPMIRHTNGGTTIGQGEVIVPGIADFGAVVYDKWIDWEIYYEPQGGATTGRIIINRVIDGNRVTVLNYTGRCLHSWSSYPFWKIGQYHWGINNSSSSSTPHIVYFDMVAYGKATPTTFVDIIGLPGAPPPASNIKPVVVPSPPTVTVNSATSAGIKCTSYDPDGTIAAKQWTQVSGPNTATFSGTTTDSVTVSNLTVGTYIFMQTVTDNLAAQSSGIVTVTVNQSPVVDLSANITAIFNDTTTQITMIGSGSDPDGTIVAYKWTPVSGPTVPVFSPDNTANTTVMGLIPGKYTIQLTITDDNGATGSSEFDFTIKAKYIITNIGTRKKLPPAY